jgi:hypothetical protein
VLDKSGRNRSATFCFAFGFAYLIDEVLAVIIAQILRSNHSVQIRLHQFLHKVHLLEVLVGGGLHDVENVDDLGAMAC